MDIVAKFCYTVYVEQAQKQEKINNLVKKYEVTLLALFGSRVSGMAHKKSDFDVAYTSARDLTLREEAEFILGLSDVFQSDSVDLLNLKKASPLLFYAALNNCELLYEKELFALANLRAYAYKKYEEARPLYEEKYKRLQKEIAKL